MSDKRAELEPHGDLLAPDRLRAAFAATVQPPEFSAKFRWWLKSLHAAERWFQFEFAYALNREYGDPYITACEYAKYADISVFANPPEHFPLWHNGNVPVAKIELKSIGNWWIKKEQADGILGDIKKVNGYAQPSIALVFCTVFSTRSNDRVYTETLGQIAKCETATFSGVRNRLAKFNVPLSLIACERRSTKLGEESAHLEYHLLGHPNSAAARLFRDCESI